MKSKRKEKLRLKKLEEGFVTNLRNEKLPEYRALSDKNLRHYFENNVIQQHLHTAGMIDRTGRIIDVEKHKGKIAIIEQEFKHAEKTEYLRQKEEEDMRRRVQMKRYAALEAARREERLMKLKQDRVIRQEIVRAAREYTSPDLSKM